ncbi:cytochrome P-450 cyp509A1 [Syncephalastrum racemosum]|uniref:Cytochrome P-450 cyp509A1 n=1 Tax=Syncephalastrum racemosum TaxID=13706 RepID=A0A1X2H8I7_SYNRA|nr:cytochrome P-450 cyp509A1 [Syncephalastrum racemosum]
MTELFPKDFEDRRRSTRGTLIGRYMIGPNILFENGHNWKRHRKVANPAFHRSMPVELFGRLTHKLFRVMDGLDADNIEFQNLTIRWTLDAIGLAGFDFDFDAITSADSEWVRKYDSFNYEMFDPFFALMPWVERNFLWLFPQRKRIHQDLTDFLDMLDKVIENKRLAIAEGKTNTVIKENEKDLLTLMIESENETGVLSNEELKSDLCIFFLAGHDTTANALAFAAYYLAVNPDIQQKAREEAIRVFGDAPEDILPNLEQVKDLPYINQIMKETLRINPPAPNITIRRTTQDVEVNGVIIPKDHRVALDIYELQHNPKVWRNPDVFDPERFAPGGEAEQLSGQGMAWLPFSNGSRQCIGMAFSLAEQRVMLPMLLRKYEWSLPADSPHKDGIITTGRGIISPVDLKLSFKKRY